MTEKCKTLLIESWCNQGFVTPEDHNSAIANPSRRSEDVNEKELVQKKGRRVCSLGIL